MEQLRSIFSDAAQYLAAASPREKRLIAGALSAVIVFAVLIGYASFSSSIRKAETSLSERRDDFAKIEQLAGSFGAQELERQALEQRLRQSPAALLSFVEGLAKTEAIDIASMSDRGLVSGGQAGRPKESQVEVNLGKVPLDKLLRLLQAIDASPGVVRVRRLRVRKSYDNKETLDVSLAVSSWQAS
jgi:type II secretory pathway component PulM